MKKLWLMGSVYGPLLVVQDSHDAKIERRKKEKAEKSKMEEEMAETEKQLEEARARGEVETPQILAGRMATPGPGAKRGGPGSETPQRWTPRRVGL